MTSWRSIRCWRLRLKKFAESLLKERGARPTHRYHPSDRLSPHGAEVMENADWTKTRATLFTACKTSDLPVVSPQAAGRGWFSVASRRTGPILHIRACRLPAAERIT